MPGFTRVSDRVGSGRKPTLEGFDSLKQSGYRTLVYLYAANGDVSAVRDVAEKRGLTFVSIETTPERLADSSTQFSRLVQDTTAKPIYVVDDSGIRAGTLWYLHFRVVEAQGDDVARVRARALGMTDEGDEAKAFAISAQQYLANR